jgi:hypothetical protein
MKVVLLMMVVLTGFLAGCTTPAELAAQDHETCTGYGFNPQTMPADYAACRMQVAQDRENRDNMTRAALFVGSAARPAPSSIPSFHVTAKVSENARDCCSISAKRSMRGLSLCSGMLGIRS